MPEAYVAAWCDLDPAKGNPRRVYRYGKDGRYIDWRTPSRMFSDVAEIYTIPKSGGCRDLSTEHFLQRLEDAYARVRDGVLARREPLTDDARADIILFVAALRARSPFARDHNAANDAAVLRVADDMKATLQTMTCEQRSKLPRPLPLRDRPGIPLEEFRRLAARPFGETLLRNIAIEAELLGRMQLSILVAPNEGDSLISSDAPVAWWDPADPPPSRRPLGLGRQNIEVTVPFSPRMSARIAHAPGPDYADIGPEAVDELNRRTLYRCRNIFISDTDRLGVVWNSPLSA